MDAVRDNHLGQSSDYFIEDIMWGEMLPDSHDFPSSQGEISNSGFQKHTKVAKPGCNTIANDALNYSKIEEKQNFMVNTKGPQSVEEVQFLLNPRTDSNYLKTPDAKALHGGL